MSRPEPRRAWRVLATLRERKVNNRLDPGHRVSIVHCNPVFDPKDYLLRPVSPFAPTVGLRDAEDLPTMLGFARFADGSETLAELEAYLSARAGGMIARNHRGVGREESE